MSSSQPASPQREPDGNWSSNKSHGQSHGQNNGRLPIRIEKLVKDYGSLRAVDHVSFTMNQGEILGLLGPNGAGKTSIISTMVTLEEPTSGQVEVFGYDVTKDPQRAKMLTGFVPQELIHHGYFDVTEILEFHSGYFGILKNKERIDWILQKLALWEHRKKKVKQLSGGMKRRLLIAKALVNSPRLLILDEPTAGVDIELRESLWRFVEELKKDGISILLTTHYLEEAEQLCDRVGILQKGQLLHMGPTKGLIQNLTKREIVLRLKSSLHAEFQHPFLHARSGDELVFQVPATMGAGDLLEGLGIELRMINDLQIREGSLEDALKRVLNERETGDREVRQ
jgi:ABC-2 type transport system ATP-binding protein